MLQGVFVANVDAMAVFAYVVAWHAKQKGGFVVDHECVFTRVPHLSMGGRRHHP